MKFSTVKDISGLLTVWISIISAVVGGAIWLKTYTQQVNNQVTDRQKESVAFLDRYSDPSIIKLRKNFDTLKHNIYRNTPEPPTAGGPAAVEAFESSIQKIASQKISDMGISLEI